MTSKYDSRLHNVHIHTVVWMSKLEDISLNSKVETGKSHWRTSPLVLGWFYINLTRGICVLFDTRLTIGIHQSNANTHNQVCNNKKPLQRSNMPVQSRHKKSLLSWKRTAYRHPQRPFSLSQ
ncbi:hypothetical protein VTO42DRAFT_1193 [Malbranchea cinnamomea]